MAYAEDQTQFDTADEAHVREPGRPRIALMGEFSAGKSTLCNLILGEAVLPTKVTATRLPPVWVAMGDQPACRVDNRGEAEDIDLNHIDKVRPEDTRYVKVFKNANLLNMCDVIDMPGLSDPNMTEFGWDDMIEKADAVIWCTHATQAWRQSEAAAWASLPERLKGKSMLLLTRFDKLTKERDKARVIKRVESETGSSFRGVFPISLVSAMAAGDDPELLRASGAEDFARGIVDMLGDMGAIDGPDA